MGNDGIKLDSSEFGELPWPDDALMIVASRSGEENRAVMEGVISATCRRCGTELAADTRTLRTAEHLPQRRGRMVMFFCVNCAVLHERPPAILDQRDGRNVWLEQKVQSEQLREQSS